MSDKTKKLNVSIVEAMNREKFSQAVGLVMKGCKWSLKEKK